MLIKLNRISELLNKTLISSDGFTISELLEKIKDGNEKDIEDSIFAIIDYKAKEWQELVCLMFDSKTIRDADSKIQYGFVLRKMIELAGLKNG